MSTEKLSTKGRKKCKKKKKSNKRTQFKKIKKIIIKKYKFIKNALVNQNRTGNECNE